MGIFLFPRYDCRDCANDDTSSTDFSPLHHIFIIFTIVTIAIIISIIFTNTTKVHAKSKMKKAFCEPGNVDFCPPIHLASVFCFGPAGSGSMTVSRSADNGGNLTYTGVDKLSQDFCSGALHPGDLKAATTALAANVLDQLAKAVNADKDTKQAVKALKNYQKKAAKSKK
jgi:hypothetical protein